MALEDELGTVAGVAQAHAGPGETLVGVVAAEPSAGRRLYLCAYTRGESLGWLVVDHAGSPLQDRTLVRDTVSITALCELAEETAGGGDLPALRAELATLRATEAPDGIEAAEEAAMALEATLRVPPRVASPAYLDEIGSAAQRLERALGEVGGSPFAEAMRVGAGAIEELTRDVEHGYKRPLG
ncbi:MAG: hypothetical protein U0R69_08595 [Gaiellales bacterium]